MARDKESGPLTTGPLARFAGRAVWLLLLAAAALVMWERGLPDWRAPIVAVDPAGRIAFDAWLAQDEQAAADFAELEAFLNREDVDDAVPAWQLTRIDKFYAERCDLPVFRVPPRDLWPNVVLALRLLRDEVEPVVGEVAVQSSYRTPELNACAGGASHSRHLSFEALDLRLEGGTGDLPQLYRELCAMHAAVGPRTGMGLGAYYDPGDTGFNRGGRFHIDAAGYRRWGRTYTSASSPCGRL